AAGTDVRVEIALTIVGCPAADRIESDVRRAAVGVLHDVPEQSELLDRLTSWRRTVRTTGEIPLLVHTAIQQLRAAPQRPVALEIAPDLMLAPFDGVYIDPEPAPRPRTAPDAAVEAVCAMLAEATSPVLYVGGGMRSPEGSAAIRAAAERLAVPIVMSQNGLGTLDAVHPLAADPLDGRALLAQADLVIGVGTRFVLSGQQLALPEECRLVLVNADADHLREPRRPDLPILSDGVAFVDALVAAWRARSRGPRGDGERRVRAAKDVSRAALADIAPQREWLDAIHAGTPDDVILVKDFTQIAYVTPIAWPHRDWACHVAPGYQGNLGYAYAAALGAAVGRPDRPVVAIVGDGGFGWTLPELATAHQYGIPAVVVVFDDGAYGNVARDLETLFEGRVFGAELVNPDFVRVAEAFHVQAARATTPEELSAALRTAIAAREPALIHVPVGRFPDPWHLLL
ncbi:thiamine pyrophosphate-dependent enzyme, partial [Microbacterium sp. NPDC096154]|uniref:thiamine pyrophosphate-dependent enzyme n=1 Tax=Microbacterium sp. NPDC096154 TaxID=3155549 RepID=UPI00332F0F89